jgi:exosortase
MQGTGSNSNGSAPVGAAAPRKRRFDYGDDPAVSAKPVTVAEVAALPPKSRTILGVEPAYLIVGLLIFGTAFGFLYSWNLASLWGLWTNDATRTTWGHGIAVPLLCFYLGWIKWKELKEFEIKPAHIGLVILLLGVTAKIVLAASRTATTHVQNLSMLVVLMGATLWILGWNFLRVLWLPIAYFVFAINPPNALYQKLTAPMQDIAANLAAMMLMLCGVDAEALGNQLWLTIGMVHKSVNVAEACSGMKTLFTFIALATVLAYSTNKPMWQKIFLVLCSFPVAIICNGLRIAIIAILVVKDPSENSNWAHGDAHGFIGLAMLLPAMLMQLAIAWVLGRIFVEVPSPTAKEAA